jgi:hypothetical protein
MIKLEDHIIEVDGVKHVPLEVVEQFFAETYAQRFDEISTLVNSAFKDYDKSVKEIFKND